jgi:hypothetical protein
MGANLDNLVKAIPSVTNENPQQTLEWWILNCGLPILFGEHFAHTQMDGWMDGRTDTDRDRDRQTDRCMNDLFCEGYISGTSYPTYNILHSILSKPNYVLIIYV